LLVRKVLASRRRHYIFGTKTYTDGGYEMRIYAEINERKSLSGLKIAG
jgi:hypothetical protein